MKRTVSIVICGGFIVSALYATTGAQARSASDGVYTEDQAKRGEVIYLEQCAACHGDNLEGMGPMPPLAGGDFLMNWQDRSVGELFEKTHATMPATAPGTLTVEQSADVTAYMLKASEYPPGAVALEAKLEPLKQIKLGSPKK